MCQHIKKTISIGKLEDMFLEMTKFITQIREIEDNDTTHITKAACIGHKKTMHCHTRNLGIFSVFLDLIIFIGLSQDYLDDKNVFRIAIRLVYKF